MPLKIQKHIEIVRSSIMDLSSLSIVSCNAIFDALSKHYEHVGVTTINNEHDLLQLAIKKPDLAFMGMTHVLAGSNKIWLSSYLEGHGINCTGSRQSAHALEIDKSKAKQKVLNAGLSTAAFVVAKPGDSVDELPLKFPLFVKPTSLGGGEGIDGASVVKDQAQLKAKLQSLEATYGADALIEEYLSGREFSVAILADELSGELRAWPVELIAELNARGHRLLDAKAKISDQEVVRTIDDAYVKARVTQLAVRAFRALGARDYGRIDIRLNSKGVPQFLEANLIPSLIEGYGSFPKASWLNASLGYEAMILLIVRLGFAHPQGVLTYSTDVPTAQLSVVA